MKKNALLRTNLLVCVIIIVGFVITAVISYSANWGVFEKDVEQVAALTSEGISRQIDTLFTRPVNVSLTMANDSLLKDFLAQEELRPDDAAYIQTIRDYLNAYRVKYGYDSVFLASAATNRYYHFSGLDRVLTRGDPENDWYYRFLETGEEYSLNIDNDQVSGNNNEITVFINCRILDAEGGTRGVVGVGFRVNTLQALLRDYENEFGLRACLVDPAGVVQVSSRQTGYQSENLFDSCAYPQLREQILSNRGDAGSYWYNGANRHGYLVTRYVQALDWFLIVDSDTSAISRQLVRQLTGSALVLAAVITSVLLTITGIIHRYNQQIVRLTVAREQEHKTVFQTAAEQFYEDIYEIDVTHNRAASEATEKYFESLGAPKGTPFDRALHMIAEKQIKQEFRQGYLDLFSPDSVLAAYQSGMENLRYDFMITADGKNYYWMRINAHIFLWNDDDSIRLLVYRQNIDAEKRRELLMSDQLQRDSLTGLYNKAATQEHARAMLAAQPGGAFAFVIVDIDEFKTVNDRYGHAAGDKVLAAFAGALRQQFRCGDVVGRIGGDEFAVFLPVQGREAAREKARELSQALRLTVETDLGPCHITASIGVAIAPEAGTDFEALYRRADTALYTTKKNGKRGFTVFPV